MAHLSLRALWVKLVSTRLVAVPVKTRDVSRKGLGSGTNIGILVNKQSDLNS